jgi:uncharacterized protein with HEPN domain
MRNRLVHNYFCIDINTVWETIVKDIPYLKKEISHPGTTNMVNFKKLK